MRQPRKSNDSIGYTSMELREREREAQGKQLYSVKESLCSRIAKGKLVDNRLNGSSD